MCTLAFIRKYVMTWPLDPSDPLSNCLLREGRCHFYLPVKDDMPKCSILICNPPFSFQDSKNSITAVLLKDALKFIQPKNRINKQCTTFHKDVEIHNITTNVIRICNFACCYTFSIQFFLLVFMEILSISFFLGTVYTFAWLIILF